MISRYHATYHDSLFHFSAYMLDYVTCFHRIGDLLVNQVEDYRKNEAIYNSETLGLKRNLRLRALVRMPEVLPNTLYFYSILNPFPYRSPIFVS